MSTTLDDAIAKSISSGIAYTIVSGNQNSNACKYDYFLRREAGKEGGGFILFFIYFITLIYFIIIIIIFNLLVFRLREFRQQ